LLQLYQSENVYIVLVGIEVWTSDDLITGDPNDGSQTLDDFCEYRRDNINPYHNNDNSILIT